MSEWAFCPKSLRASTLRPNPDQGPEDFSPDQESILCGLPALILKWAWPELLEQTGYNTVAEMVKRDPQHRNITRALQMAKEKLPRTRIVLLSRDGRILADVP